MKILSVNSGSSTLKFQLYDMPEGRVIISGNFERIGEQNSCYTIKSNGNSNSKEAALSNHEDSFKILVRELLENKVIESLEEINGVGHRVVQGGSYFSKAEIINEDVISKIEELSSLAPLHNPAAVIGIKASIELFNNAIQVAVFDTAFHQTIPVENYLYAVPYEWYEKYKVRRYGMHGTSHKYVSERASEILGRKDLKLITCHIGNGASISAIKDGKCINTSMGLTPNAGLIMGTRCGDIDATIIPYIMEKTNLTYKEIDCILNKESGLLAISKKSGDFRDIVQGIKENDPNCILAKKMHARRIIEYISKYYVELNGCDAIIFTAGIGENRDDSRKDILEGLSILGVKIDDENNKINSKEIKITSSDSKIASYVIPTDEELMIAKDTFDLIR